MVTQGLHYVQNNETMNQKVNISLWLRILTEMFLFSFLIDTYMKTIWWRALIPTMHHSHREMFQ